MKTTVKVFLWTFCGVTAALILALLSIYLMGYRFTPDKVVHSSWADNTHFEVGEYTFYLDDVKSNDGEIVYATSHRVVKKHGFLYKAYDVQESKYLIDEYGSWVGNITRYEGQESDCYFIHWGQGVTELTSGTLKTSMRYYTDKVKINGRNVKLKQHCFFELAAEIETIVINNIDITIEDTYEKGSVQKYAPVPENSGLEFWITDNVAGLNYSEYEQVDGWMGAREIYGKKYHPEVGENGYEKKPEHYVTYLITSYPDYADGGSYVTRIEITDPEISIYGLTVNSTVTEFKSVFEKMGYVVYASEDSGHFSACKNNLVNFVLTHNSDGDLMIKIYVDVTNSTGIIF